MPLLGSYGGSSEYAYRGTIDDFPNDFSFTNQTNAIPGQLFTSNQVTITGINNRARVRVSAGASVSVNGGSYVIPTEASPVFIFNNQTLSVRIPSTSGQLTDFDKLYTANVSVGKKTSPWQVRTKTVDVDPTPFTFINQTNREIGVGCTSNEITISGLEPGFSFPADITLGSGQIIKNGGAGVPSVSVVNGDRIYLLLISPSEYSNFPTGSGTRTNSTTVRVGSYSTSWSVSARDVDIFVNPFDFDDVDNALIESDYTATVATNTGINTTTTATLTLTSSTVSFGSSAPNSIYRSGISGALNRTPQLSWGVSGLPPGVSVQSYAIQLEDLSSLNPPRFVHWNLTGIASTITNIDFASTVPPAVATVGPTNWPAPASSFLNGAGYGGPQPPAGERHTYRLTVRANLTGAGTSSVLVKGINFLAGAGTSSSVLSPTYPDQSSVISGILTNVITGADQGIPLVTAVTGCELSVDRPVPGGFSLRSVGTANTIVFNGDRLRVRIKTGSEFSQTKVGIVTVSNATGQFRVTTRPRPIDTIPDPFTFTDITANRGATVDSNEITLVGMSTFSDEGDASITTGTNGGSAQFQVTRGTTIIKPFSATTSKVRNGDKIKLRITASSDQNITRTATFRVDGIDTNVVITGTTAFRDDTWSVISAERLCDITTFTIPTLNNVNPSTVQTTTFTVGGFQSDCGMVVSTNVGDLSINGGQTFGNNLAVSPGTTVTLRVTSSPNFSTATVATVTVSNASTGVLPSKSFSTSWTINTVADNRATSVSLTASPTSITPGQSTTLTWSSVNGSTVTAFSGEGFTPTTPSGSASITLSTPGTRNYSISVQGPPSSVAPGPVQATTSVTVQNNTTPDVFSLSPSSLSEQNRSVEVSAVAQSSTNSNVSVSGLTAGVSVNASISGSASGFSVNGGGRVTSPVSVTNGDRITVFMTTSPNASTDVTGTLTIGDRSSSFTARTKACSPATNAKPYANGAVTVNFKAAKVNGSTDLNLYTSKSGGFTQARAGAPGSTFFAAAGTPFGGSSIPNPLTIPPGVTSVQVALVGGGGGGGPNRGGGAGGVVVATIPVSGGQSLAVTAATAGSGGPSRASLDGTEVAVANGGSSGFAGGGGGGGSVNPPASGSVTPGNSSSGKTGGSTNPGGPPGSPGNGGQKAGGGSGGGVFFSQTPGGGIEFNPNPGQQGGSSTGSGVQGSNGGGSGGAGLSGWPASNTTVFAPSSSGGRGGAAVFYQGSPTSGTSYDELIDKIVSTFNSNASRPPSEGEMDTYINRFTTSSISLDTLGSEIVTAINNGTSVRANSLTDSCGGTFS